MGWQIEIFQSEEDEREIIAYLQKRDDFIVIDYVQNSLSFTPCDLGNCHTDFHLVFRAKDVEHILACVEKRKPSLTQRLDQESSADEFAVNRVKCKGLVIEWSRTVRKSGMASPGRFYLSTVPTWDQQQSTSYKAMEAIMNGIRRRIAKTYPMRSDERFPRYVGPHLWKLVQQGDLRIVHTISRANETKLVPNNR
jgi:transposase-like protein